MMFAKGRQEFNPQ